MGGAQEVVRQISERLAARGHEVTVATSALPARTATSINGVAVREFEIRGNAVRGMSGDLEAYRRFVLDGEFDVVMTYAAQQWTTDALLPVVEQISQPVVLAPCGFSGLHDPAYAGYFRDLRDDLLRFDALIFHSDTYQDIRFARAAGAGRITVIPNGADEREFGGLERAGAFRAAHGIESDEPLLLTVGGHTGMKGHREAMSALRASDRARTLAIIGNTPIGRGCLPRCRVRAAVNRVTGGGRVILADPPREQVLAAYADADLFVFCSRIECSPLVLFEAIAAGLPFVSVDVGNAGEIADWSGAGVIAGRAPGDVAAAVDQLLADAPRRAEMAKRGRAAWRDRFTWDAVTGHYEQLYGGLAQ